MMMVGAAVSAAAPPEPPKPLEAQPLGGGTHAFIGGIGEAAPENRGEIGNGGFIVGDGGTVVINTGSSYLHGRRMIEAAERIGGQPVVLGILTQPLQEFVMGTAAFAERDIPVLAHEAAARLIGERCERCLRNLKALLGESVMRGTRVIEPQRIVAASEDIVVGGRRLHLLHPGWAQTPGDLAIFDAESGVLFAGALVSIGRVPELRDARPAGWLQALTTLQAMPVRVLVPGYGPPGTLDDVVPVRDYLTRIERDVGRFVERGAGLQETIRNAGFPAFEAWSLYPLVHERNIQYRYLKLELDAFEQTGR